MKIKIRSTQILAFITLITCLSIFSCKDDDPLSLNLKVNVNEISGTKALVSWNLFSTQVKSHDISVTNTTTGTIDYEGTTGIDPETNEVILESVISGLSPETNYLVTITAHAISEAANKVKVTEGNANFTTTSQGINDSISTIENLHIIQDTNGLAITWQAVDSAAAYMLFINTIAAQENAITDTLYKSNSINNGDTIELIAYSDANMLNIIASAKIIYTAPTSPDTLALITGIEVTQSAAGAILSWLAVDNAKSYHVFVNSTKENDQPLTSNMLILKNTPNEGDTVLVRAFSDANATTVIAEGFVVYTEIISSKYDATDFFNETFVSGNNSISLFDTYFANLTLNEQVYDSVAWELSGEQILITIEGQSDIKFNIIDENTLSYDGDEFKKGEAPAPSYTMADFENAFFDGVDSDWQLTLNSDSTAQLELKGLINYNLTWQLINNSDIWLIVLHQAGQEDINVSIVNVNALMFGNNALERTEKPNIPNAESYSNSDFNNSYWEGTNSDWELSLKADSTATLAIPETLEMNATWQVAQKDSTWTIVLKQAGQKDNEIIIQDINTINYGKYELVRIEIIAEPALYKWFKQSAVPTNKK